MLKKTSNFGDKSNNNHNDEKKKRPKIQWDEVTIAEHDKERGTRQKIDEAPTPYRYMSESEQSENEYSSDGEHLARCKAGNSVMDSWEALHAKLQYEKHLQDLDQANRDQQMTYDYSSSHDTNTGDEMSVGANDPKTTEFGEVVSSNPVTPIRPAIKKPHNSSSGNLAGMSSPKPKRPEKARKSVHIKATIDPTTSSNPSTINNPSTTTPVSNLPAFTNSSNYWGHANTLSMSTSPSTTPNVHGMVTPTNNNRRSFSGMNNHSIGDDDEDEEDDGSGNKQSREQFKRKRAGHYNEFKVLQAMRAKLRAEEGDDDEDEENDEDSSKQHPKTTLPPALIRQRSLEKVNSLQPTAAIANSNISLPNPPGSSIMDSSTAPPAAGSPDLNVMDESH